MRRSLSGNGIGSSEDDVRKMAMRKSLGKRELAERKTLVDVDRGKVQAQALRRRVSEPAPNAIMVKHEKEGDLHGAESTDVDSMEEVAEDGDTDLDVKEMAMRHEKLMRDIAAIQRRIQSLQLVGGRNHEH